MQFPCQTWSVGQGRETRTNPQPGGKNRAQSATPIESESEKFCYMCVQRPLSHSLSLMRLLSSSLSLFGSLTLSLSCCLACAGTLGCLAISISLLHSEHVCNSCRLLLLLCACSSCRLAFLFQAKKDEAMSEIPACALSLSLAHSLALSLFETQLRSKVCAALSANVLPFLG